MTTIIAGNFEAERQASDAERRLLHVGFPADRITNFSVNPPGQHDQFPIGGDRDASPGAENAEKGTLTGAAVGGAIGLGLGIAAVPIVGPAAVAGGAGVGAYVGALAGTLGRLGDEETHPAPVRKAGILVAVHTLSADDERLVVDTFREFGAHDIERAQGTWRDGQWEDFDPVSVPHLIYGEIPSAA